jgi:putative DNA primase/helicase
MVKLAESELPVVLSHKLLDDDPMLLGVQNGVIELATGTFREGRREDYISKRCEVAFDPDATCPEWRKFQAMITGQDVEVIAYKQRVAGAFLTGKVIEVLFIPWGCGSNGKSTELETYQLILGEYGHATDASLLLARKETAGPTPEIIALKGKRAIFINETPARGRADAKANGVKFGRKPKLTPHQKREAIKRRDRDGETLRSIGRSYNVSAATIGRLAP